jgi:chromate transporter
MKTQWNIFMAFFRAGILGYGGGPASIPLVYKEVVERYKWMDDEEFGDILALGNTLPGPIATKLAGYIGYRVSGYLGMTVGLIASVLPTVFLMILLLTSLDSIKEFDWVNGMIAAVIPVVGVMMATLTWQFFNKAQQGLGWLTTIIMSAVIFLLLAIVDVHPAIIIAVLLFIALVKKDKVEEKEQKREEGTGT